MGMPTGPGSTDFNPCSLPFLLRPVVSILTQHVEGDRRRGKDRCWCWGGWMTYGEEEGTVLYRLHLLQNAASSLSSIPHLISLNNLPFSSCPNRESQNLRERECVWESAKSHFFTSSLFLSADRVIKLGEKQRAVRPSEEVVESSEIQGITKRPAMTNISDTTQADMIKDWYECNTFHSHYVWSHSQTSFLTL